MEDAQILAALRGGLFTAVVGDVMDGIGLTRQFLPATIRPLRSDAVLAGRAMTVAEADLGPGQPVAAEPFGLMLRALDDLKADEIYICAGASPTYALWGGLMATRALKLGAAGAVLGGRHRDTRELLDLAFPIFSEGACAQDQKGRGIVTDFRIPITFANGVRVAPGDFIFGDIDGVVVIPQAAAGDVVRLAVEKATGESVVRRMIQDGASAEAAFAATGIM
jgi:regulator of RNase E activity RraA